MPDMSAVSAFTRDYRTQFVAGFLTTVMVVAAGYAAIDQFSQATSTSHILPPKAATVIDGPGPTFDAAHGSPEPRQPTTPQFGEAAHEIAGRFADLTPAVSVSDRSLIVIPPEPNGTPAEPAVESLNLATSMPVEEASFAPPADLKPMIRLNIHRDNTPGAGAAFPLDLNASWSDKPVASLLIGGLPEGVMLSAGRQTTLGLWKLSPAESQRAQLIVAPTTPVEFALTVFLLDPEGLVVNGIDVTVAISETVSSAPAQAASAEDTRTPNRWSVRRGDKTAKFRRHKAIDARHAVHKSKRFQTRRTVTALRSETVPVIWRIEKSKTN